MDNTLGEAGADGQLGGQRAAGGPSHHAGDGGDGGALTNPAGAAGHNDDDGAGGGGGGVGFILVSAPESLVLDGDAILSPAPTLLPDPG